ncbi:DUF2290 domain-containing protein [Thermosynechococcus sp. JY1334]|uniref:DUF2290 domain-containing protein n=1 Tax=unclassified Thermosynechococcus TaxID=2622553 RepID=UPI002671B731|nr:MULTISPECIES: DUF2290 domain-containing protein [unclassified Thermosynechococcus]MDR7898164.1 DUF2290 domain-containing protein [Thermosynechococcus sp. JY1332]MDR7905565.1 DUF2290 domain-containing protein [Thermosynechococcus sp. JY1334]MDR7993397.1 DUF2290 domain-containing protein [Thermosynechococcus sp. TG252]WKT85297.1 DUF2290 domain-containing protein [Thermosynechococcus sp. JY1339]WNC54240.1 DUF2290 domain-containing protein [Thermosynechococcus sp. JY1331]
MMLFGTGIINDQNFPKIVRHPKSIWDVKFDHCENIGLVISETDYSVIHQILTNNRYYSVKMIDGGLLQLIYRFQRNTLIQHRLAYYLSSQLLPFQEDPASYFEDTHFLEIINRRTIAFPLRFDFDQQAAINKTHPACHLTLGDAKN